MVKWYSKIAFLFCIVTIQQTSFGMITKTDGLQIGLNIGLACVFTIADCLKNVFESTEAKRTIESGQSLTLESLTSILKSCTNLFKVAGPIVFLRTPQIIHTCFAAVKKMNLPVPLFRYLPDTFAVSPMAIDVGLTTLLNPFLLRDETNHYLATKFIIQFLFCVAAQNNPILNNKYNALTFNQISQEISPQLPLIAHMICFLLLRPQCTEKICTKASEKLPPKSKKMASHVNKIPIYLTHLFQARQYIWLTLAILTCFGIQGTQNRILYDWKYWVLVGSTHVAWVNTKENDLKQRFQNTGQTIETSELWRRYAFLLGLFWIPITAAIAATFYEVQCAKTG